MVTATIEQSGSMFVDTLRDLDIRSIAGLGALGVGGMILSTRVADWAMGHLDNGVLGQDLTPRQAYLRGGVQWAAAAALSFVALSVDLSASMLGAVGIVVLAHVFMGGLDIWEGLQTQFGNNGFLGSSPQRTQGRAPKGSVTKSRKRDYEKKAPSNTTTARSGGSSKSHSTLRDRDVPLRIN